MTVDLELLIGWAGAFTALGTPVWFFMRKTNAFLDRLKSLESWTCKQQEDIEQNRREMALILTGTLACLKGHREQGCNGAVTKSISEIENFLLEQALKGKSRSDNVKSER